MVPHCVAEQDSVHLTPWFLVSLATVAVSRAVEAAGTAAIAGEIDTLMTGAEGPKLEVLPPQAMTKQTSTQVTFTAARRDRVLIRHP